MARDKSVVYLLGLFVALIIGVGAGWTLRGGSAEPAEQTIGNGLSSVGNQQQVGVGDTSILLPRSVEGDEVLSDTTAADGTSSDEAGIPAADTDTDGAAIAGGSTSLPTSDAASPISEDVGSESSSSTSSLVSTVDGTTPDVEPVDPDDLDETDQPSDSQTAAESTVLTTVPQTLVLTDPTISSVQFQSPVACVDGAAVALISWATVDASAVAVFINGTSVGSDLEVSGELDAEFACSADGQHEVELVATGITSDPNRPAFTSSVVDRIQTEG